MPDRLDELRKQRALVQQHLTWLDHEIAAVTVTRLTLPPFAMRGGTKAPMPSSATTPPVAKGTKPPIVIPELSDFAVNPDEVQVDTRKGCILYAALAFVVLVLICVAIYFFGYRDNPVLFVPAEDKGAVVYPAGKPAPAPVKRTTPPPAPAPANPPPK